MDSLCRNGWPGCWICFTSRSAGTLEGSGRAGASYGGARAVIGGGGGVVGRCDGGASRGSVGEKVEDGCIDRAGRRDGPVHAWAGDLGQSGGTRCTVPGGPVRHPGQSHRRIFLRTYHALRRGAASTP